MTLADQTESEATRHARRIRRARHTVGSSAFYDSLEWLVTHAEAADQWKRLALDMGDALRHPSIPPGFYREHSRELLARLDGIARLDGVAAGKEPE